MKVAAGDAIAAGTGWTIQGTTITATATDRHGITVLDKDNLRIRNSQITAYDTALLMDATTNGDCDSIEISDSVFRALKTGVYLHNNCKNVLIQNSTCFADSSVVQSPPTNITMRGVWMKLDLGTNAPAAIFQNCLIRAAGSAQYVTAIELGAAKATRFIECDIRGDTTSTDETGRAEGVLSFLAAGQDAAIVNGAITTTSIFDKVTEVYDVKSDQGVTPLKVSGTRFSKWRGAPVSAERPVSITQQIVNVRPGTTNAILPAVTLTDDPQEFPPVSPSPSQPDAYRVLSITVTGSNPPSQHVYVVGTDWAGNKIVDKILIAPGTVIGNKPFKTVTKIYLPAKTGPLQTVSVGTTHRFGLYNPISATSDALRQGRKASTANSYTLEAVGTVDVVFSWVEPFPVSMGDSFEWSYLAVK